MPCPLCQQQNRAVLLPKSPQTSQKFPKTPMSSVRSCLGHSTCGSRKKSYHVHTRKASTSLCRRQKLHIAQQCFTADAIRRFTLVGKSQPILTSRRSGVQPDRSAQLQPTREGAISHSRAGFAEESARGSVFAKATPGQGVLVYPACHGVMQ